MGGNEGGLIRQLRQAEDWEALAELEAKKPKLDKGDQWYLTAFFDLDTERSHGYGITRIPRSVILGYADECELSENEKYDFVFIIRLVDNFHCERLGSKRGN